MSQLGVLRRNNRPREQTVKIEEEVLLITSFEKGRVQNCKVFPEIDQEKTYLID